MNDRTYSVTLITRRDTIMHTTKPMDSLVKAHAIANRFMPLGGRAIVHEHASDAPSIRLHEIDEYGRISR